MVSNSRPCRPLVELCHRRGTGDVEQVIQLFDGAPERRIHWHRFRSLPEGLCNGSTMRPDVGRGRPYCLSLCVSLNAAHCTWGIAFFVNHDGVQRLFAMMRGDTVINKWAVVALAQCAMRFATPSAKQPVGHDGAPGSMAERTQVSDIRFFVKGPGHASPAFGRHPRQAMDHLRRALRRPRPLAGGIGGPDRRPNRRPRHQRTPRRPRSSSRSTLSSIRTTTFCT